MNDWPIKTLGEVCDLVSGSVTPKPGIEYQVFSVPSFDSGNPEQLEGSEIKSSKRPVKPGDVLLCKINPRINRVWRVDRESKYLQIASTEWIALRSRGNVMDTFLQYVLQAPSARTAMVESVTGATGSHTRAKYEIVEDLEFPVPPLGEQKRIVALLDFATARVTELTACYEQARTHANNLFTSASREAFESNPDWPVKTIGDVCAVLDSLRKPITKRDRTSGDYPYYGATGIVDYVGDYIFDERLVLVGEDGAKWDAGDRTAFIAEGKYWVNNHAHVLRCKPGVLVDSWLTHYLTMSDLNRYVSGLTVPKLNQGSLVSIAIPVPPLEEQERIVGHLDSMKAKASEMVAAYDAKLTAAKNLRQSILEAAFAGEL